MPTLPRGRSPPAFTGLDLVSQGAVTGQQIVEVRSGVAEIGADCLREGRRGAAQPARLGSSAERVHSLVTADGQVRGRTVPIEWDAAPGMLWGLGGYVLS